VVKGRTDTNLLTDAVAGCESTSGWGVTYDAILATDSTKKVDGTNSLKVTIATGQAQGSGYRDILSLFLTDKYYLLTANIANGNATNIKMVIDFVGDVRNNTSSLVTNTTFSRVGLVVAPTDFNSATNAFLYLTVTGSATNYANFDTLQLQEISATDYALGVPALLDKYTWHLGTKSVDKMRVKSVGKNLFDGKLELGSINTSTGADTPSTTSIRNIGYTKIKKSTVYSMNANRWYLYDDKKVFISTGTTPQITTTSNTEYIRIITVSVDLNYQIQLELGSTATIYEPYQQSQSICPLPLRAVPSVQDTWDSVRGKHVQNISDWVTLSGNAFTWNFNADYTAFKEFNISTQSDNARIGYLINKYNNKALVYDTTPSESDTYVIGNYVNITASDIDTGWLEAWVSGTSFTGLSWNGLIKAYMNGWKLTTANVNVASCVWTGITSGTTKTGASGYTDVTTTLDVGFTPYKMIYQLATPITTYLQPSVLSANANGTIYQERFVEDYGFYNSGLALTDSTKLITNLVEVRKWNIQTGAYTIIPNSSITLTTGVITAITSAVTGEFYSFDYNYDDNLSLNGELNYSYAVNMAGQVAENTNNIITLDKKVDDQTDIIPTLSAKIDALSDNTKKYGASVVGTDAYAITTNYKYTTYTTGLIIYLKADVGNTGASTINVDGLGAKVIKVFGSAGKVDTLTGDMIALGIYTLVYDGTDFVLTNPNSLLQSLVTAQGDILYASGANTLAKLAKGTSNQFFRMNTGATAPEWFTLPSMTIIPTWGAVTASDNLKASSDAQVATITDFVYRKIKQFTVPYAGVHRVKYTLVGPAYHRLYKNGVALTTELDDNTTTPTAFSNDVTLAISDTIEVWVKAYSSVGYVSNCRIYYDNTVVLSSSIVPT